LLQIIEKMSKQKIMYSHVADWQSSGLTQSSYCENVLACPGYIFSSANYFNLPMEENTFLSLVLMPFNSFYKK